MRALVLGRRALPEPARSGAEALQGARLSAASRARRSRGEAGRSSERARALPSRGSVPSENRGGDADTNRLAPRAERQSRAREHPRAGDSHRRLHQPFRRGGGSPPRERRGFRRDPDRDFLGERLDLRPQGGPLPRPRDPRGPGAEPRASRGQDRAREGPGAHVDRAAQRRRLGDRRPRVREAALRGGQSLRRRSRVRDHRGRHPRGSGGFSSPVLPAEPGSPRSLGGLRFGSGARPGGAPLRVVGERAGFQGSHSSRRRKECPHHRFRREG